MLNYKCINYTARIIEIIMIDCIGFCEFMFGKVNSYINPKIRKSY
jgi:hypothetical protein